MYLFISIHNSCVITNISAIIVNFIGMNNVFVALLILLKTVVFIIYKKRRRKKKKRIRIIQCNKIEKRRYFVEYGMG
jgi:hypothetical protein